MGHVKKSNMIDFNLTISVMVVNVITLNIGWFEHPNYKAQVVRLDKSQTQQNAAYKKHSLNIKTQISQK